MRYQVDTHAHTLASTHAYSTIHDYIAEAKRKGIIIFAITDHGPEPDLDHGMPRQLGPPVASAPYGRLWPGAWRRTS